ncbi:hypothetical protein O6H91_22G059600 [Diphasiastrum complanatum]|uniref:Uncharacterized protein n=1 Tax=Diphasiastrum complanatum TaxID=34168 RepID=A0ACC2AFY7_DIPCM|nr:hypothetical protein O6H91_22G059600 [Diphasiastrum complanatum]
MTIPDAGSSPSSSSSTSAASHAPRLTFLQRLAQRRQQLGGWALATSCLLLSLRLMDQKKVLDGLKAQESDTILSLREENRKLKETLSNVREVLLGEEGGEGSELPAFARLEHALGENGGRVTGKSENLGPEAFDMFEMIKNRIQEIVES